MMIRETTTEATHPRRSRRTVKAALVTVTAVAAIGVLAGCGGGSSSAGAASTGTAATPDAASTTYALHTQAAVDAGGVPALTNDQRKQVVYILEAVNPGVSTDAASLVKKSVSICGDMRHGVPGSKIAKETREQFSNGSYTPSPAEVQAMDMAIVGTFCP
jgi:hypothetical protein